MSRTYIVVALHNDELEACELFSDGPMAMARAFYLATSMCGYNVSIDPNEDTLLDGAKCWTFCNTTRHKVKVLFQKVTDYVPSHSPAPAPYDFNDPTLPVGWFQNGKPALMSDLRANPFDVKDPLWDLTDAQKWALIEVRVRRSPGFHSPIGTSNQATALASLQGKTSHGLMLRDEEIESLHALREDLMAGTQNS